MNKSATPPTPELLYLLSGDEDDFATACADFLPADIAEGLNGLPLEAATRVVAALPFHRAVQVFDEPQLTRRGELVAGLEPGRAIALIEAMSSDQQVELFRELTDEARARLIHVLDAPTRDSLNLLLRYPPTSAGGIMTTEFMSVPAGWNVDQVKTYIREVGQAKETVYAIYVLDQSGRVLGIVTVDDIIDALVSETTEDVQKFGGMEALDEPYMQISLAAMVKKRAGWLCALFLGEMLTATAMGHFEAEISKAVVLALFIPLI